MKMQILDVNYTFDKDGRPVIQLFGKNEDGKSACCFVPDFAPYFYARTLPGDENGDDTDNTKNTNSATIATIASLKKNFSEIVDIEIVQRYLPIGYQTKTVPILKIVVKKPGDVPTIRDKVKSSLGIVEIYETDILFKNRFMVDRDISPMGWIETGKDQRADYKGNFDIDSISSDVKLVSTEVTAVEILKNAPLRSLAFDIECLVEGGVMPTPEHAPVIMISLAFDPPFVKEADSKGNEKGDEKGDEKGEEDGESDETNGSDRLEPEILDDIVLLIKEYEASGVEWFKSEADMLRRFFDIIQSYDPDIIVGYNSNSFDIPYILDRIKTLKDTKGIIIDSKGGRDGRDMYYRTFGNTTRIYATGRLIVDDLPLIRRGFSLKQYKLETVAKELLGLEKLDVAVSQMEEYWNDTGEKFDKFVDYARRDSVLALKLMLELRLLDKHFATARLSGTVVQDVLDSGQTIMVENLLLKRFAAQGRVMATKPDDTESAIRYSHSEDLKGGEVLEPEHGLLNDLVILDYKSLYPTIMMAHNLCYTTVVPDGVNCAKLGIDGNDDKEGGDCIIPPSGGRFVKSSVYKGIVPQILEDLLNERTATKKLMNGATGDEHRVLDARQFGIKILLNSFYGYSGYARARLYSLPLANAVTSFGRQNILDTRALINDEIRHVYLQDGDARLEKDFVGLMPFKMVAVHVVYGDTDSVFVAVGSGSDSDSDSGSDSDLDSNSISNGGMELNDLELIGSMIAGIATSKLPPPMELEFESVARRAIFIAKKRYAIWVFEKSKDGWDNKIKVKGMETVRRDWCGLTSKTLMRVLELVLKEGAFEKAARYVKDVIASIRSIDIQKDTELLDDLILTKRYTKKAENYKNRQPHLTVVAKMKARGEDIYSIGDRIPFVVVKGRKMFVDRVEDPGYVIEHNISIDVEYYVSKQILPPVGRILTEFGISMDELNHGTKQKGLFDFVVDEKDEKEKRLRKGKVKVMGQDRDRGGNGAKQKGLFDF